MSNKFIVVIVCLSLLLLANLLMSHGFTNNNSLEGFMAYLDEKEHNETFHPALHRQTVENMLTAGKEPFVSGKGSLAARIENNKRKINDADSQM